MARLEAVVLLAKDLGYAHRKGFKRVTLTPMLHKLCVGLEVCEGLHCKVRMRIVIRKFRCCMMFMLQPSVNGASLSIVSNLQCNNNKRAQCNLILAINETKNLSGLD